MDIAWAIEQLRQFIEVTRPRNLSRTTPSGTFLTPRSGPSAGEDQVVAQAEVVEQILDRVLPEWRRDVPGNKNYRWARHRESAQRSLARLERQAELAEKLGDSGPQMSASGLHRDVWDAAKASWRHGAYGDAVRNAARAVNSQLREKLGRRDVQEADLVTQAFTAEDPKPGKPRLRLSVRQGDKDLTFNSIHEGAAAFGRGCFQAIRNVLTHEYGEEAEPSEQSALEYLAAFSVLARWIEQAEVQRHGEDGS
jgi:uncharacterized protein (TIGR02391 family)